MSRPRRPISRLVEHETIRSFDLVSTPALDDRAVQELAAAMNEAATAASEAFGGLTRRESAVELADTLEPIDLASVAELRGARFHIVDPRDDDAVLGLLHLDDERAVALADIFFGGPGRGAERRMTPIEQRAIVQLAGEIVAPIVAAATHRMSSPVRLVPVEDSPRLDNHLVQIGLTLTVGQESNAASVFVADPDKSGHASNPDARRIVTANVATMPIDLDIELASVEMPAAELQTLATGDVILFDVSVDAPAVARHGRHRLLDGHVVDEDGRRRFDVAAVHPAQLT